MPRAYRAASREPTHGRARPPASRDSLLRGMGALTTVPRTKMRSQSTEPTVQPGAAFDGGAVPWYVEKAAEEVAEQEAPPQPVVTDPDLAAPKPDPKDPKQVTTPQNAGPITAK